MMVYLLLFVSYLADSKSISVRPAVRPGYNDKYRSTIIYRFVERPTSGPARTSTLATVRPKEELEGDE